MRIAILGPTGSGKSSLAVALARRLRATVVNGDPFQALAGIPIGTGQPDLAEQGGVPHVGYGVLPLSERPNPGSFGELVRGWMEGLEPSVLVTGSGLYLRGIWGQLSQMPEVDPALVARVRGWSSGLRAPVLHRFLAAIDPARAAALHPNDTARVQRALALHLATGQRPSDFLTGVAAGVPEGWRALVVLPSRDRQRGRVAARVRSMVTAGWREEVVRLVSEGHGPDLEALRPLGYLDWMRGGEPRAVAEGIIAATQAYARRQETFFRGQWPEIPVWDPDREDLEAALLRLGVA